MIEILPFTEEHYDRLSPRFYEASAGYSSPECRGVLLRTVTRGEAFTAVQDGKVIAFGGYYFGHHPGCVEVWMQCSDEIYEMPLSHARKVIRAFRNIQRHCSEAWRFQTTSYPDEKHTRWMKWLGFAFEGTLKKITPDGGDLTIWALVR